MPSSGAPPNIKYPALDYSFIVLNEDVQVEKIKLSVTYHMGRGSYERAHLLPPSDTRGLKRHFHTSENPFPLLSRGRNIRVLDMSEAILRLRK